MEMQRFEDGTRFHDGDGIDFRAGNSDLIPEWIIEATRAAQAAAEANFVNQPELTPAEKKSLEIAHYSSRIVTLRSAAVEQADERLAA